VVSASGPYNHIAKVGNLITIGGTAGVNPATSELAGEEIGKQTRQILDNFRVMLESVGSDLAHVVHVNIFLGQMSDFEAMNAAYVDKMGDHRPARTVIGVGELPKPRGALDDEPDCRRTRLRPNVPRSSICPD
jgi:2-iminobutanoate/2-iminopropanoate deaminase